MSAADQGGPDTPPRRFRVAPDTVAQRVGEEVVLVHMKTDRIFVLNCTGARVWELLREGADVAGIRRRMQVEFDVGAAQLEEELASLLTSLEDEGLILDDQVGPDDESGPAAVR